MHQAQDCQEARVHLQESASSTIKRTRIIRRRAATRKYSFELDPFRTER